MAGGGAGVVVAGRPGAGARLGPAGGGGVELAQAAVNSNRPRARPIRRGMAAILGTCLCRPMEGRKAYIIRRQGLRCL